MADKNDQAPAIDQDTLAREQARQKALAEANAQAQQNRLDETRPGGYYIVNGVPVNSEGEPIKDNK